MRKILPILILSVAAVFLLSSCDQILEALFPNETGHGGSTNNSITFNVSGQDETNTYFSPGNWPYDPSGESQASTIVTRALQPVYVNLFQYGQNGALVSVGTQQVTYFGSADVNGVRTGSPTVTFSGLNDGSYEFQVYYDLDGHQDLNLAKEYSGYYYTAQGYVNSNLNSSVYVSGGSTSTVGVTLYEWTN